MTHKGHVTLSNESNVLWAVQHLPHGEKPPVRNSRFRWQEGGPTSSGELQEKRKNKKNIFFLTSRFWLLQVKRFPGKLLATFVASCSSVASCLDAGPGQITHRRSPKVAWSPGLRPVGPIPVAITAPPRRREPPNPESPCSTDLVGESLTSPSFSGRSGGRSSGTACFGGSATGVLDELITCRQAHGLGARRGTRDEGSREKGKSMEVLLSMRAFAMVFPIIDMCLFCCFFSWMCSMNQR